MVRTDQALDALIGVARDVSAPVATRHQAFEEIVRRFQNLALACARLRLRDPALAEDAAQDAFLVAWERLSQLRETAAFPGWLRRLVLTQCRRRLRAQRVELPLDSKSDVVAAETDPAADLEAADAAAIVRLALHELGASDRLALILFYGSGHTQAEIAHWLGVPVTTVARRLAHAKRRMRGHLLRALSGGLRAQQTIAGTAFMVELSARLRSASSDDDPAICNLANRLGVDARPDLASGAPQSSYLVEHPASHWPIAYAAATPTIFRPIYDLHLIIGEDALKTHAGDVLLTRIVRDMVAGDVITLRHRTSARHATVIDLLTARGFQIVSRAQDWRLGPRVGETCAETAPPADRRLTPLAEMRDDPFLFEAALELLNEAAVDNPSERPFLPIHPERLRRGLQTQQDGVLAIIDGTLHGLLTCSPDDAIAGGLRLNCLVVRKNRRREGVATAMLARLVASRGTAALRLIAQMGPELAGWLKRRGFVHFDDCLVLERILRKTVAVAPTLLDEYVGRYTAEMPLGATILIERHGASLISKTRDMHDLLLAASESEFFTTHHDGRGRFERDERGRVTRLVCTEGSHEFVAIRH